MPKNQLTYITTMAEESRYRSHFLALPPYAAAGCLPFFAYTGTISFHRPRQSSLSKFLRLINLGFHFECFWLGRSLGDTFPVLSHLC